MSDKVEKVKVSFNLTPREVEAVKELAERRGSTATAVLRNGLAKELFFDREVVQDHARILLKDKDGSMREVVFPNLVEHQR
jgi:hypothetical protein